MRRMKLTQKSAEEKVLKKCKQLNLLCAAFVYKTYSTTKLEITCQNGHTIRPSFAAFMGDARTSCNRCRAKSIDNPPKKYGYINVVRTVSGVTWLQYGMDEFSTERVQSSGPESKHSTSILRLKVFEFETEKDCKIAYMKCKALYNETSKPSFQRLPCVLANELNGLTETGYANLDKIVELFSTWGGIEVHHEDSSLNGEQYC